MVVYIVTTQNREGRAIKAVFEDRDQAEYCCALLETNDAMLEEWDTEALEISGKAKPLAEWLVIINPDGKVIDIDHRYTFTESLRHSWDIDGSCAVRMTQATDVPESKAQNIALDYWRQLEKKNHD